MLCLFCVEFACWLTTRNAMPVRVYLSVMDMWTIQDAPPPLSWRIWEKLLEWNGFTFCCSKTLNTGTSRMVSSWETWERQSTSQSSVCDSLKRNKSTQIWDWSYLLVINEHVQVILSWASCLLKSSKESHFGWNILQLWSPESFMNLNGVYLYLHEHVTTVHPQVLCMLLYLEQLGLPIWILTVCVLIPH